VTLQLKQNEVKFNINKPLISTPKKIVIQKKKYSNTFICWSILGTIFSTLLFIAGLICLIMKFN